MNIYKKDNYKKEDTTVDQNCITCGLHSVESEKSGKFKFETKESLCLIKQQITHLHEKILGCSEDDDNTKPRDTLPVNNEFLKNDSFTEFQKGHKCLLEDFSDKETYEERSLPNLKSMDKIDFLPIETATDFQVMLDKLQECKDIAVNLEYYSQRSYLGFSWLLQISTEDKYYMINCLKLQKEVHSLNTIFMNNKISKIFHEGENAVLRLYKDFGIFTVNMIDTAILKKMVEKTHLKFKESLIFKTNHVHTHCLIYLKNYCLSKLQRKDLKTMRQSCIKICKKVHDRVNWNKINFKNLLDDKVTNRERNVAKGLLKLRDTVAQIKDESPNFILPDNDIFKIAREIFHDNWTTFDERRGERFFSKAELTEIKEEAKEVSNSGKNYKSYLDKQTKQCIDNKFNATQVQENNKVFERQSNQDKKNIEKKKKANQLKRAKLK